MLLLVMRNIPTIYILLARITGKSDFFHTQVGLGSDRVALVESDLEVLSAVDHP